MSRFSKSLLCVLPGKQVSPASYLDHVLVPEGSVLVLQYYDFEGNKVSENSKEFLENIVKNTLEKRYMTTDHLPFVITYESNGKKIYCIHISSDNSVRANMNGFLFYQRVVNICNLIKVIIADLDNQNSQILLCMNEVGRPSFNGKTIKESSLVVEWSQICNIICDNIPGLVYQETFTNNPGRMAFGLGFFTLGFEKIEFKVENILPNDQNGCVCVGVNLDGKYFWFTHFPIDFDRSKSESKTYSALKNLIFLLEKYPSACACGDFNTIFGKMADAFLLALEEYGKNIEVETCCFPTFYGAFFDTIPNDEGRVSLEDYFK